MSHAAKPLQAAVPSVDRVLGLPGIAAAILDFGRNLVVQAVRDELAALRTALSAEGEAALARTNDDVIVENVRAHLVALTAPRLRPVFNLTGTVLHTNLGRAPLPQEALEAMTAVAAGASNLEYDLETGKRGDRDDHVADWICRLTGAEAATVVNNNAAAVLLTLNTLALRRQVLVSRGELIEIGGSFRLPDIMARAGAKLVEVGATNRTHAADFETAISAGTALIMKAHTSNYVVQGFTAEVAERDLVRIAHAAGLPFVVDLGSGTLTDLTRFGLPYEPTPADAIAAGADIVTFSGDKLLGGPQAGIIVGRADLVKKIKRNPMKRAMRLDKMTLAALSAVLRLYGDPDRLAERVPALRLLSRPEDEIRALAERLRGVAAGQFVDIATVEVVACRSQIGSGALPVDALPSAALAIRPKAGKRGTGRALKRLATAFRRLPIPVIGRIADDTLLFDLRCLEDEDGFVRQLGELDLS